MPSITQVGVRCGSRLLRNSRRVTNAPDAQQGATALIEVVAEFEELQRRQGPGQFLVVAWAVQDRHYSSIEPVLLEREQKLSLDPL